MVYRVGACKGCKQRREALARQATRVKTAFVKKVDQLKGKGPKK